MQRKKTTMNRIALILATVLSLAFTQVTAQDFDKGVAAFSAGKFKSAAREFIQLADAEYGDVIAQLYLAVIFERGLGTVPQNYEQAFKYYQMAAENGNHISIGALGRMYLYGYGVPQDHTKALDWLRKGRESTELSSGNVEYNLSVMYKNGWGVPKDHKKAFELAKQGADLGNNEAKGYLGKLYTYGYGTAEDYTKAVEWLRKGLGGWYGVAEYNLSVMHRNGWGVPKDHKKAFELAYQAAKAGHADAQNALGANYQKGTGVSQDYVLMQMWYIIAEQNGNELAVSNRKFNTRKLTSSDLSKAKIMAKECMSSGYKKCQLQLSNDNIDLYDGMDDKLSSKSLLEGAGYGLLYVDLDEGVFEQTQTNFKEFVGAECSKVVSELKKTEGSNSFMLMMNNFYTRSGGTIVEANHSTFVLDDCVFKMKANGVPESIAKKSCKDMGSTSNMEILDRNDDGLVTYLQAAPNAAKETLSYDNLDIGLVSSRLTFTKQQIDDWGAPKYQDSDLIVCVISE